MSNNVSLATVFHDSNDKMCSYSSLRYYLPLLLKDNLVNYIFTNLEYRQNNNNTILFVIDSPVLFKKSLLYIFSEIGNFFSIIHIISFYSFNSKRIKFTYPPA